jgi:LacI family transcriptional regulator
LATASKVLNGREGVGDQTRQRVKDAMDELEYRPTTARASEPSTDIRRVNVIFGEINVTMYLPETFHALMVAARDCGVELIPHLMEHPQTPREVNAWAEKMLSNNGQGVIVIANALSVAQVEACERLHLPVLAIDSSTPIGATNLISIGSNNFAGGHAAGRHLLSLGHRRFGLVRGPANASFARERAFGFLAALDEEGIVLPTDLIVEAHFAYEGGLSAGEQLLNRPDRPTAIATNCDACAIGVMEAARKLGLQAPADVSVVGYDDSKLAVWSTPQLTSVRQPLAEIARMSLRMLSRMIDHKTLDSPHVQLATELVVRDSTAAPPGTPQQ